MMTHGSLFSGIGGFELACAWAGLQNVFSVEKNEFCQKVLSKNFPHHAIYGDIRTFNEKEAKKHTGTIDLISGGFPCQPFSIAGKRAGKEDDRYLWGEMLRTIRLIQPSYVLAENVGGLLTIEGGLVFENVCTDLEDEGYQVQPFVIPAVAQDAPHRRDRVWIIAHSESIRRSRRRKGNGNSRRCTQAPAGHYQELDTHSDSPPTEHDLQTGRQVASGIAHNLAYPEGAGLQTRLGRQGEIQFWRSSVWANWYEASSTLCRVGDGLPSALDKLRNAHKGKRIEALGNSIVPQVAYQIIMGILESDRLAYPELQ